MKLFFERFTEDETVIVINKDSEDFVRFVKGWESLKAGVLKDMDARVVINNLDEKYLVKLYLKAVFEVSCDRCLAGNEKSIEISPTFLYSEKKAEEAGEDVDKESSEERFYLKGKPVELLEVLREELLLELPQKTLCSEDCKGICEKCGVNLNISSCSCVKDEKFNTILIRRK